MDFYHLIFGYNMTKLSHFVNSLYLRGRVIAFREMKLENEIWNEILSCQFDEMVAFFSIVYQHILCLCTVQSVSLSLIGGWLW